MLLSAVTVVHVQGQNKANKNTKRRALSGFIKSRRTLELWAEPSVTRDTVASRPSNAHRYKRECCSLQSRHGREFISWESLQWQKSENNSTISTVWWTFTARQGKGMRKSDKVRNFHPLSCQFYLSSTSLFHIHLTANKSFISEREKQIEIGERLWRIWDFTGARKAQI